MATIPPSFPKQAAGSFLAALFDTTFSAFITLKLIRFLYILGMLLGALSALALIVTAFNLNSGAGVLALLFSPVVFLLNLIWVRVVLELIAIVFRIEENTARIPRLP